MRVVVAASDTTEIPALPGIRRLDLEGEGLASPSARLASPSPPPPARHPLPRMSRWVLQTSGTTSRPKTVPLTHANLTVSAANIAESLALTADDRCLLVMPLFHIHGLIAGLLAPLSAGAPSPAPATSTPSASSSGSMRSSHLVHAVPTMHQLVLARAPRHAGALAQANLRFVRSSSAPSQRSFWSASRRRSPLP